MVKKKNKKKSKEVMRVLWRSSDKQCNIATATNNCNSNDKKGKFIVSMLVLLLLLPLLRVCLFTDNIAVVIVDTKCVGFSLFFFCFFQRFEHTILVDIVDHSGTYVRHGKQLQIKKLFFFFQIYR